MSDYKGPGIWRKIKDEDALNAIGKGCRATYVVANWLRGEDERYKHIKTSQVLHRLKALEKQGKVKRVKDSRNPYEKMIVWELAP